MREPFKVQGHIVKGEFVAFPHLCLGSMCAILQWLRRRTEQPSALYCTKKDHEQKGSAS